MKYIDGFRDPAAAAAIGDELQAVGNRLAGKGRTVSIMEVCGSHTMAIGRYGIRSLLPGNVTLISGPGCPVCVTPVGYIDAALELAGRGVVIATFGDLLNVPGTRSSLAKARSRGAKVEMCVSPMDAISIAGRHPDEDVVFLAIGFETTVAPIVTVLKAAIEQGVRNLSFLPAFKLVPPALEALMSDPDMAVDSFLCPAHVSAVIGSNAYEETVRRYNVPCVVAGFEPLDILYGLLGILQQIDKGEARVENQYSRVVKPDGNRKSRALTETYMETVDASWRGIGLLPRSGLGLKPQYRFYDAETRHTMTVPPQLDNRGCLCGEVIKGKITPPKCPMFDKACTPETPLGPCMVSSEGSCAAYYRYERKTA
jgi:hydrogenase expression/formation protein HypD